ncbi:MAG: peptidoglycan-binding protein [Blastocatellia bacterium]|nr:MAG: peptidoglycan-binding protein [Blastocatellia bacterium]
MTAMNPEKLTIINDDASTSFDVLFNPERYTLNKGVQIAEIAIPGLDSPVLQFIRGQNEKITMELFFDTTEFGMLEGAKDVRELTRKVYELVKINRETHAPPRCSLYWKGQLFSFGSSLYSQCIVESINEEFNLFSPSGVPLRAKLNVTFREYKTIEQQLKETPKHSSDRRKVRILGRGKTVSHLAGEEYNDPGEWRLIADANNLDNPRLVAPGTKLEIPPHSKGTSKTALSST